MSLYLGNGVDGDSGLLQSTDAALDDRSPEVVGKPSRSDEDGVASLTDLEATVGSSPKTTVRVTNTTGKEATLYAWLDSNRNGIFDNNTERVSVIVPSGANGKNVVVTFPRLPFGSGGTTYVRLRLSTDKAASNPVGAAADGEVEDHKFVIRNQLRTPIRVLKSVNIGDRVNGGPDINYNDLFGWSSAAIGDLNQDGVTDIVVTAPADSSTSIAEPESGKGAIYVMFMNTDGRAKSTVKIGDQLNGGPVLAAGDYFGTDVTSIGDIDGDGSTDIAVGASGDDTGGIDRGAVYIIRLNKNGTARSTTKIASSLNGGPALEDGDEFGSVEAIGDMNGDGVTDLAVGAASAKVNGQRKGKLHIVMMTADGTVKSSTSFANKKPADVIYTGDDLFAQEIAWLGDLDGDGTTEIAALSSETTYYKSISGILDVLSVAADGTLVKVKRVVGNRSEPGMSGAQVNMGGLSRVGDLNGDGVIDLSLLGGGFVSLVLMNADGSLKQELITGTGLEGSPNFIGQTLSSGGAVSLAGDLDGDGASELVVGLVANKVDSKGNLLGGLSVLSLKGILPNTKPPAALALNEVRAGSPEITWPIIDEATGYELWIQNSTTGKIIAAAMPVVGTSFKPPAEWGLGRYIVAIRATNEFGKSAWSNVRAFSILFGAEIVPTPDLIGLKPTLQWKPLPGATRYELRLLNRVTGGLVQKAALQAGVTKFTPDKDLAAGTYYFTVTAFASDGTASAERASVAFQTNAPVELQIPDTYLAAQPEIKWKPIADATSYELWLSAPNKPSEMLVEAKTSGTYFKTQMLRSGEYTVKVRAVSSNGAKGRWSSDTNFRVLAPPEVALLASDTQSIFLRWCVAVLADRYEVWIRRPEAVRGVHNDEVVTTSENEFSIREPVQGVYQIWVRAIGTDGRRGNWCPVIKTTLQRTIENVRTNPDTGEVNWQAVPGASSYRISVVRTVNGVKSTYLKTTVVEPRFVPQGALPVGYYDFQIIPVSIDGTVGTIFEFPGFNSRTVPKLIGETGEWFKSTRNLQWTTLPGIVSYNVFVRDSFGNAVINLKKFGELSMVTPELRKGAYSWWVQGVLSDGRVTDWSDIGRFHIGPELNFSSLPASSTPPVFRWNTIEDAEYYELVLTSHAGELIRKTLTSNEYVLTESLTPNYWYRARITAFNSSGSMSAHRDHTFWIK